MKFAPVKRTKLAQIAVDAGDEVAKMQPEIAANFARKLQVRWHYKDDDSIVTDADIKANEMICAALKKQFPGVAILSEENPEADNLLALKAKERFETDPLDNTKGFAEGKDGYSINIGRIVDGLPVDGVIYFPARKELYFVGDDGKAYCQIGDGKINEISTSPVQDPLRVAVSYSERHTDYIDPKIPKKETKFPAQMRTCKIASGQCDISGINQGAGGFNTYDIAGPHAVLLAAGGDIVQSEDGKPFRYDKESLKVPHHIVGSKAALTRHVPGYRPERADIPMT